MTPRPSLHFEGEEGVGGDKMYWLSGYFHINNTSTTHTLSVCRTSIVFMKYADSTSI